MKGGHQTEKWPIFLVLSAAAEEGKSLLELDQVFDSVTAADNLGTIGFSTSGCSLPVGKPGKFY